MKEQLSLLIELQKADADILEKLKIIDTIPKKISSFDSQLKEALLFHDKQKQLCNDLENKRKDKERQLDDINEKVKKQRTRLTEIKTNKEYQAHLKEIEAIERERYAVEDEVLSLMEAIDAAYRELRTEDEKVKAEKEKIEKIKTKLQEEVKAAEQELDELKLRRAAHVKTINAELYDFYMKILQTKRGLAVVEAKDEICCGCNMSIPPQLFVELKKNEELIQCPQCNRILYCGSRSADSESKELSGADKHGRS